MRNPPILISVIGFFAALAGFGYLFFGLRVLGFDWFGVLGDLPAFDSVGLWGWLAIFVGIVWLLVAVGLWALQPWARIVAMIVAGHQPVRGGPRVHPVPGHGLGFAMAPDAGVIIWYLNSSEVKAAFGETDAARGV